jgi:hypothetical protein
VNGLASHRGGTQVIRISVVCRFTKLMLLIRATYCPRTIFNAHSLPSPSKKCAIDKFKVIWVARLAVQMGFLVL